MIEKYMFSNSFKANTSNTPQLPSAFPSTKPTSVLFKITFNQISFLKLKKK